MTSISEKQKLIGELQEWIVTLIAIDCDEEVEDLWVMYNFIINSRYISPRVYQKHDDHFFTTRFAAYPDNVFRSTFRTTREVFSKIYHIIRKDPVFSNNSNNPQTDPGWQLAIVLARFGHYGNMVNVTEASYNFGISEGAFNIFTKRIIKALLNIASDWIKWPDMARREQFSNFMRAEGFPGCVGFIDGTTIPLSQKPANHGNSYYDRKNRYV